MKNKSLFFLLTCFHLSLFSQDIHVSISGNDNNSGSKKHPLRSLLAAREKVRTIPKNKTSGINIIIHAGYYELDSTFELGTLDSGMPGKPITWKAAPNEKVMISGAKRINPASFTRVNDRSLLQTFDASVYANLLQVNLYVLGIREMGQLRQFGHALPVVPSSLELFINGTPMNLAHYPNSGYVKIGKVADKGSIPRMGDKSNRGATFAYTDMRHKRWAGLQNIWLQGTFNYGFADDFIPVASIDTVKNELTLAKPHLYGVGSGKDFQQYKAVNIFSELDSPGEWFVNTESGMLYLWPPENLDEAVIQISMLESPILSFVNTRHISWQGMTIEGGRGMGVYLEQSQHVQISDCTIRNVGTCGIFMGQGARLLDETSSVDDYKGEPQSRMIGSLQNHLYKNNAWNRNAGANNGILSCEIYNTGSGGVFLSGGDKRTLAPGNSYVENCRIHDFNRRNKFIWAGINVDGVGNRVSHNEIYNSDWQGIFVHGNDHVFEYNFIHDVTLNSDDTSPWYIGRNPSDRGNVVRYNHFSNCGNPNRMNMGVYCDDSSTDVLVYGNLFTNMKTNHGVLFSNSGWELVMQNNIIVNPISHSAVVSAHYYTWAKAEAKPMLGENGLIRKRLEEEIHFREEPYASRYPGLLPYLDVLTKDKEWAGMRARGNLFEGNLIVGGPDDPVHLMGGEHAQIKNQNNWVTKQDPGFKNLQGGDFRLRKNAKVFRMIPGFKNLPIQKMGTYPSRIRS